LRDSPFEEPGLGGHMEDELFLSAHADAERIMGRVQA